MKIAIDTSCLLINPNCGLSEVVRNLIFELPLVEKENQFTLFYNYFKSLKKVKDQHFYGTKNHTLRLPRRLVDWLWKSDWFLNDLLLPDTDIYHSLHVQMPPSRRLKMILTVHDCRFLAFPELYLSEEVETYRHAMNRSLERADMVVAVSKSTREEIIRHFRIPEDRIKVIYNGFNPYVLEVATSEEKLQNFKHKNKLSDVYLLFVGVLDPRKNLMRLIEALSILKKEVKDIPDLVIAGISLKQWYKSEEAKQAEKLGILKHVHVVGIVEKNALFRIMAKAFALCYPSLYEGFGFPPLEAMSQGIPVLAGKNFSIPEVTGDAACLVNPLSVNDIAKGLHQITFNSEFRNKLIKDGFNQIKKFSWRTAATDYVRLYKKALA